MFARKDLERDVLSAYQRHRRNLKKASADSKSDDSKQPRMVQIDAAEDAEGGEGSGSVKVRAFENEALDAILLIHLQSPTSDVDSSYTYTNTDEPITKGRSGSSNGEVEETGEMMDHKHESAAEEAEMREHG